MRMNLLELQKALKQVDDKFLQRELISPTGKYPAFMVVSEMNFRKEEREKAKQSPTTSVAEDVAGLNTIPTAVTPLAARDVRGQGPAMQQPPQQRPPQQRPPQQMRQQPPRQMAQQMPRRPQMPSQMPPQMPPMQPTQMAKAPQQPRMMNNGGLVAFFTGGDSSFFGATGADLRQMRMLQAEIDELNRKLGTRMRGGKDELSAQLAQKMQELEGLKLKQKTDFKPSPLSSTFGPQQGAITDQKRAVPPPFESSGPLDSRINILGDNQGGTPPPPPPSDNVSTDQFQGIMSNYAPNLNIQMNNLNKSVNSLFTALDAERSPKDLEKIRKDAEEQYGRDYKNSAEFLNKFINQEEKRIKKMKFENINDALIATGASILQAPGGRNLKWLGKGLDSFQRVYTAGRRDILDATKDLVKSRVAANEANNLYMQGKEKAGLRKMQESMALDKRATEKASTRAAGYAQQVSTQASAIKDVQQGSYYKTLGDVYKKFGGKSATQPSTAALNYIAEETKRLLIEQGVKADDPLFEQKEKPLEIRQQSSITNCQKRCVLTLRTHQ